MTRTRARAIPSMEIRPPSAATRPHQPRSLEATLLELQRTIGNAGVTALMAGAAPALQRAIGWPDAKTKNAGKDTIAGVDRYPIYGLSSGNQLKITPKNPDPKKDISWYDGTAVEKADKRAIVLIPHGLKPTARPDVLFQLHGFYVGWREGKIDNEASGAVKDDTRDQSAEGIVQSLPPNMIAVLPQGTAHSDFGGIDPPSYIRDALAMVPDWADADIGRVVLAAHSGGGGTMDPRLGPKMPEAFGSTSKAGKKVTEEWKAGREKRQAWRKARLPAGLREIALFDAINGTNELASVRGWLWDSVTTDIETLKAIKPEKQMEYVDSVVVFRGYYETKKNNYYGTFYEPLRKLRDSLLDPEQRPPEISERVWEELGNHYDIQGPLDMTHHQMVKQNLPDALKAMNLKGSTANPSVPIPVQRKPPVAAPPAQPPKTEAQIEAEVEVALDERYRLIQEASSQMSVDEASDQGMSVVASGGAPLAKHTVVGGARQVAAMWKGIESHIVKPSVGKPPIPALSSLYSAEGVASLKALGKADRQQLAADIRALLTTYATDDQLRGSPADVDTIVGEIVESFWQSYKAAGGPAAGPEHIAVPERDLPLYYVKSHWPQIDKQLLNPRQRPKDKAADELMHVIYVGDVVDQLGLLPPPLRAQVRDAIFDLLTQVASDEAQSAKTVDQDWAQLTPRVQEAIEYKRAGLVYVRGPLLNTFGSFKGANGYYGALVDAGFAGTTAHHVYSTMKRRIDKAEAKLKELDPEGSLAGTVEIGGLAIRENRSQKSKLSNHSFGCAIDVNPATNPMVKKAIADQLAPVIEQITGVKLYEGSKGPPEKKTGKKTEKDKNFTWGLTAAEVLPEAQRLRTASDKLKAQFQDEDALKNEMLAFAQHYASDKNLALAGTAEADTLLAGAKLVKNDKTLKTFGRSIYIEQGPLEAGLQRPTEKDGLYVARMLVTMYGWYVEGQELSEPEAIAPGPGDVVRFGFLNLDPRVIAALAGSDGGGLKWLGAQTGGNKDFMHFDLPGDQLPPEAAMNQ